MTVNRRSHSDTASRSTLSLSEPRSNPGFTYILTSQMAASPGFLDRLPDQSIWDHDDKENKCQRRYAHYGNPSASEITTHRPLQPFGDQIHTWQNNQCHEERKCQTENNGP